MVALVALLLTADEPRTLKYIFKPGDQVKYITTQLRTNTYKKSGRKVEVSLKQESANLWKVQSVSPDGVADVSQSITRLRITQKGGPLGVQVIDSAADDNSPAIQQLFDDVTKAEIRFKMRPNGEVTAVVVPEALKERLKPKKEGEAPLLTEEGLARMVKSSIFILPSKPLKIGDGWNLDPYRYTESGHLIVMNARFTYEGPESKDGKKLIRFNRSAEYEVTKPKDQPADAEVTVKRQAAEGYVLLDAETCRLVESNMGESLLTESGAGAQKLESETVINTTIRLKEPAQKEPTKEKAESPTP